MNFSPTGHGDGLQEMGTAIPRELLVPAECSQESAVVRMTQMSLLGAVAEQDFLGRMRFDCE